MRQPFQILMHAEREWMKKKEKYRRACNWDADVDTCTSNVNDQAAPRKIDPLNRQARGWIDGRNIRQSRRYVVKSRLIVSRAVNPRFAGLFTTRLLLPSIPLATASVRNERELVVVAQRKDYDFPDAFLLLPKNPS